MPSAVDTFVGGFDNNAVTNNYSQGGPAYSSEAGGAYIGYGGASRGPNHGGTAFYHLFSLYFVSFIYFISLHLHVSTILNAYK